MIVTSARSPLCALLLNIISLRWLTVYVASAPPDPGVLMPGALDGTLSGPDHRPFVHKDDEDNIYFDVYAVKGEDNRIMYANNGVLVVSIGPTDVHNTVEYHLWKFIATVLEVDLSDIDILLFPGEIGRRVLLRTKRLSEQECTDKIKEYLQPYISGAAPSPGKALLHPYTPLVVYAQNDTEKADEGHWKYYEIDAQEGVVQFSDSDKQTDKLLMKKLLELKPFYEKDPSLMAKVFRDLGLKKEAVFRGRLVPGSPVKPILDDYRGPGKVKVVRRILKGLDGGTKNHKSQMRLEMSHPVPDLIMLDYLSPDKKHVVSRRVVSPFYRNETVDLIEELEYTEVV